MLRRASVWVALWAVCLLTGSARAFSLVSNRAQAKLPTLCKFASLSISLGRDEPLESAMKKFKRMVRKNGHLVEMRHKDRWETTAEKTKRKSEAARKLNRIARINQRAERISRGEIYVLNSS